MDRELKLQIVMAHAAYEIRRRVSAIFELHLRNTDWWKPFGS